jgi:hypothetical protein
MQITRKAFGFTAALLVGSAWLGCATDPSAGRVQVIHPPEQVAEAGGIAPDKQAEIQLLLQQREPSTTKCYSDVLNEKHDRAFKGSVSVIIVLEPSGQASDVRIASSTLDNKEVHDCLIEKIKGFEFPQIEHSGSMQYVYQFQPAY